MKLILRFGHTLHSNYTCSFQAAKRAALCSPGRGFVTSQEESREACCWGEVSPSSLAGAELPVLCLAMDPAAPRGSGTTICWGHRWVSAQWRGQHTHLGTGEHLLEEFTWKITLQWLGRNICAANAMLPVEEGWKGRSQGKHKKPSCVNNAGNWWHRGNLGQHELLCLYSFCAQELVQQLSNWNVQPFFHSPKWTSGSQTFPFFPIFCTETLSLFCCLFLTGVCSHVFPTLYINSRNMGRTWAF